MIRVFPKAEFAITALPPRKPVPLSVTNYLNSVLRQVYVKGNVSFIFEEDFVDHKVSKPMRLLYFTDWVHLNMKGLSLWLRKVRAFLGLVTLLSDSRQNAEEQSHYDNPTAFRVFKNAEPRNIQKRMPTVSIPVVTGNHIGEHFLPGTQSRPAHSPGCREQETTTAQSLARNNMHPMPFFQPAWPFPPYRPGPWPNPFPSLVPSTPAIIVWRSVLNLLNGTVPCAPPPLPVCLWWVTKLPSAFCNIRIGLDWVTDTTKAFSLYLTHIQYSLLDEQVVLGVQRTSHWSVVCATRVSPLLSL